MNVFSFITNVWLMDQPALTRESVSEQSGAARPLPWLCISVVVASLLASTATVTNVWAMAIVFVCSVLSTIAGFAFSALAGAVLFHLYPDPVQVVSILLVSSLTGTIYTVWATRHSIDFRALTPYCVAGALSAPLGMLFLLKSSPGSFVSILGCFLCVYGAYSLIGAPLSFRHDSFTAKLVVGALGGITGALAAFPSAFLVIWCRARGMDKHDQLAIVQPFILFMQVMIFGMLVVFQPSAKALSVDLVQFVAPAILGAYTGLAVRHFLTARQFNHFISVTLIVSGLVMVSHIV